MWGMWGNGSPEYSRLRDEVVHAQGDATRKLAQALKWFVFPVAIALLLLVGTISLGPDLAAAEGHGVAGYFVAEVDNCYRGLCAWTGDFVTADGRGTRQNVGFRGPHGTLYRGARLAALDTGGVGEVYARQGSRNWITDLALTVAGVIGFGWWAWRVAYRAARRRVRLRGLDPI